VRHLDRVLRREPRLAHRGIVLATCDDAAV
jgi:hypothetical protein